MFWIILGVTVTHVIKFNRNMIVLHSLRSSYCNKIYWWLFTVHTRVMVDISFCVVWLFFNENYNVLNLLYARGHENQWWGCRRVPITIHVLLFKTTIHTLVAGVSGELSPLQTSFSFIISSHAKASMKILMSQFLLHTLHKFDEILQK